MNFKEICRTCLRSGEMMSSLFDEKIQPAKHTAADLLAMFTSVQVSKEDDFPHNICDICLKEIRQAYLFDLKCKKSEIILHQLREIRVNSKKLNVILKQNDIVCEVACELENIIKEDFKLENIMNLCDRNSSYFESSASGRNRSDEEENVSASDKLKHQTVKEECIRNFQLVLKSDHDHSNYLMKDDTKENELERIQIVSNFQIVELDCDPKITLTQEPDHNSSIIRNNLAQNELELKPNSSNIEILDKCAPEYQVVLKTEPDQNYLIIKDNENEEELKLSVTDSTVVFKSEPELDIGIDCNDEQLECSACLNKFQSLDMFRSHIVSDHLEDKICKICNEEFECSQFEHLANHLPFSHLVAIEPENPSGSSEESIRQTKKVHMKTIHKDESIGKPDYQCQICSKVFVHRFRLVNHMRVHTGEKPFVCELCPAKFGYSRALLCHRRTKHRDKLISDVKPVAEFQCSICYKVFGQKCILRNHMRTHTGEKPYDCELCPEKFKNSSALLCHRRTKHTDELISDDKPVPEFQCSVCHKVFGMKCLLRNHMRTHTGEKPFDCELCPEKFINSKALRYHRRTKHTDELISDDKLVKDLQCSVCSKIFGHKYLLRDHMRLHTGEKPFQCKLCPEKFRKSETLLCHRRTKHTDELISDDKPVPDFQCSICYKVFGMKYLLRDHILVHTGEKPFQCESCTEKFRKSGELICHRRTKHRGELNSDVPEFQCTVCNKIFGLKCLLRRHMRGHTGEKPFQCKLCPEKFGNSNSLLCHKRTKHKDELISDNKPVSDFQCSICYKVFGQKYQLKNHMRMHTGEKPFQCKLCLAKFQHSQTLKIHVQTKHTDQVTEKLDFKCKVCSKVFVFKHSLSRHMRMHSHIA